MHRLRSIIGVKISSVLAVFDSN